MRPIIIILIAFLGLQNYTFAQTSEALTPAQKEDVEARIIAKLNDFQYNLSKMADRTKSQTVRTNAFNYLLTLFIGNCEYYYVTDLYTGRKERRDAVKMQTSSIRNGKEERNEPYPMKNYLKNIKDNKRYTNIKITQSDFVRIDNFYKVADGKYEAIAHIHQYFYGYGGERGKLIYSDNTTKTVRILIDYREVETSRGTIPIIEVKLSDMSVTETERIR